MTKNAQLTLIDRPRSWRMDEHTREVGRAGVARAREALRAGLHGRTQHPPGEARADEGSDRAGRRGRPVRSGGPRRAAA